VEMTMTYTHVVRELRTRAKSPLDLLGAGSICVQKEATPA